MKKVIIALIAVLTIVSSFAQTKADADESTHLTFKGVPIDGTLAEFVTKMKQSGFTHIDTEDGMAMLKGDFAAYTGCFIGAIALKQKDLVSKISVIFPKCDTWSSLSSNYFSLKEMLTEKYGKPLECVEEFQTHSEPRDDNSKMYEVRMDRCKYYAIYETEKGDIQLSIRHSGITSCHVGLAYYDKINEDIIRAEAMDDL